MPRKDNTTVEHLDVLIIGAGISGIGAAYYLQRDHPGRSYRIFEAREASGGTWDLFRYPGIRSDSDLHTFGYEFKPWEDSETIAGADKILAYLRQTAAENGIEPHIRFQHKVLKTVWCSREARWSVEVEHGDSGERSTVTCSWIFAAAGYYRYDQGYTPAFKGTDAFKGQIIHPQQWPEDLDYAGKRVVVIGSGATAITLVPAMARQAQHVTMLQRTPSYIMSVPREDAIGNLLRRRLPGPLAYAITRRKNIGISRGVWRFCKRFPKLARRVIRANNRKALPAGYPVDEHFNPPYNPWDQRLCAVPGGDLFRAISRGTASVVTEGIDTFTETGVRLSSGKELEAEIIVTATGLNLQVFGGIAIEVDGEPVDLSGKVAFKGMMLDGIPNFAFAVGYTNSSWTLKIGLVCEHFCRIISHMDELGHKVCVPTLPRSDMPTRPLLDFKAGYVLRSLGRLPRQGPSAPWVMSMDYFEDRKMMRDAPVNDPNLRFSSSAAE